MSSRYKAMVSSDWNECLAPCGPFDFISFSFPNLETELSRIFRRYTGNRILLADATRQIERILPHPISPDRMDAYLAQSFSTYSGVPELIEWCLGHNILFMINTTGMIGYFQRALAGNLLPRVPVISANPMIRYPNQDGDIPTYYVLNEIRDKSRNTAAVAHEYGIPAERIMLLGDSGGDGPHFEWGSKNGAFLIGSMTKPSLVDYCRVKNIRINLRFGIDNPRNHMIDTQSEGEVNFTDLAPVIDDVANR